MLDNLVTTTRPDGQIGVLIREPKLRVFVLPREAWVQIQVELMKKTGEFASIAPQGFAGLSLKDSANLGFIDWQGSHTNVEKVIKILEHYEIH